MRGKNQVWRKPGKPQLELRDRRFLKSKLYRKNPEGIFSISICYNFKMKKIIILLFIFILFYFVYVLLDSKIYKEKEKENKDLEVVGKVFPELRKIKDKSKNEEGVPFEEEKFKIENKKNK